MLPRAHDGGGGGGHDGLGFTPHVQRERGICDRGWCIPYFLD